MSKVYPAYKSLFLESRSNQSQAGMSFKNFRIRA